MRPTDPREDLEDTIREYASDYDLRDYLRMTRWPEVEEAITAALASAWDEGYAADPTGAWDGDTTHPDAPKNPYQEGQA